MGGSVQFSDLGDLTKVGERKRLNDMLRSIFGALYGGIGGKMIARNGIDGIHLSYEAKSSITTGARNRIKGGNRAIASDTYKIGEYETADLQPSTPYTFVVKGAVNAGQKLMVRFNDGLDGGISADFNAEGIAIIRANTPDSLTSQDVGFYNSPQATAINGSIEWACMYKGNITSPEMEWIPAPEDTSASIDLLAGEIGARVKSGDLETYLNLVAGLGVIIGQASSESKAIITGTDFEIRLGNAQTGLLVARFGSSGGKIDLLSVKQLTIDGTSMFTKNSAGGISCKML